MKESLSSRVRFLLLGVALRLLLLSSLLPSLLCVPPAFAEKLPIRLYTVSDGLAHNRVNKIVLGSNGFLWFCTGDGLSRFDGYGFANFGVDQGLPHPNVSDFIETRDGHFWVATNGGLVSFNPNAASRAGGVNTTNAGPSPRLFGDPVPSRGGGDPDGRDSTGVSAVNVLFESRNGEIWCGANDGLYRLEQSDHSVSLRRVDLGLPILYREQSFILSLVEDRAGSLWAAAPSGLYRRSADGALRRYTKRDGLPDEYLHTLLADDKGRLWAGSRFAGFFQFEPDRRAIDRLRVSTTYGPKDGLPTGWVFQLIETSDRRFWAATDRGLIEFYPDAGRTDRRFRSYTTRNGIPYPEVTALGQDMGGNLWVGTSNTGAFRLSRNGFTTYDSDDGVATTNAIFQDRGGTLCVRGSVIAKDGSNADRSTTRAPIYTTQFGLLDDQRLLWFKPDALPSFGWVSEDVTIQAKKGDWWIGTDKGLYHFAALGNFVDLKRALPLAVYTTKDGLAASQVYRLFEDSRANVWVSTISSPGNGLARWEPETDALRDLTKSLNLPPNANDLARSFGEDRSGNVWIGFSGAVVRYHDGGFTVFTASDGLPAGMIDAIYLDRAGRLWLASDRSGLIRVDDPAARQPTFTIIQGLSSNDAEVVTEDSAGRIYVGGGRGLDQLEPDSGRIRHFTTADGLARGGFLSALWDTAGELWFGTTGGLSRFRPDNPGKSKPPPILIDALKAGGSRHLVSALGEREIVLPELVPNQNNLEIDFVGLSFETGDVLGYQYRLEGADGDWGPVSALRTVAYANLSPGHYRFLVRAVNSDGVASDAPASVEFTVLAPVWRRPWFVAMAIAALAMLIYSLYRYRVARLLQITNIRTRIATDLHDDIGANLTRIALLSDVAKQQLSQQMEGNGAKGGDVREGDVKDDSALSSIGRIARESVGSMSDIVWAIDPGRDTLLDLTRRMRQHADELFTLRDINLTFNAPDAGEGRHLGINLRRDLLLIFKEAVNNAARHSACTEVVIDLHIDGPSLLLQIADNGVGFDSPGTVKDPGTPKGDGAVNARPVEDAGTAEDAGTGDNSERAESRGQGLRSMRRRAASLGGALRITSTRGGPTIVRLSVPLSSA